LKSGAARVDIGLLGRTSTATRFEPQISEIRCAKYREVKLVDRTGRSPASEQLVETSKPVACYASDGGHELSILIRRVG